MISDIKIKKEPFYYINKFMQYHHSLDYYEDINLFILSKGRHKLIHTILPLNTRMYSYIDSEIIEFDTDKRCKIKDVFHILGFKPTYYFKDLKKIVTSRIFGNLYINGDAEHLYFKKG